MNKLVIQLLFYLLTSTLSAQVCVSNTTSSDCLSYHFLMNDTIRDLTISNDIGRGVELYYSKNIVIENCLIESTLEEGIYLYDCENVTVINCSFRNNRSGVVALFGSGIQILHCQFQNPGDFDKKVAGQFVQFDKVTGAQNKINNNVGEAILGKSYPEDLISIYKSFGDGNNPIEIKGNRLRGGGPSNSGGGIMTGDLEGGNIIVEDNILVNPGQYGIAIASGKNIRILNNKVYGKKQSFTNVGIYVWNQSKAGCSDNEVRGNFVNFTDSRGNANSHWDGGNCGAIEGWDYNDWNSKINESILPAQLLCTDKKNE